MLYVENDSGDRHALFALLGIILQRAKRVEKAVEKLGPKRRARSFVLRITSFVICIAAWTFALDDASIHTPDSMRVDSLDPGRVLENLDLKLPKRPISRTIGITFDGPVDKKPCPISIPEPQYPNQARLGGIEGMAVVKVLVEANGHVIWAEIHRSSGSNLLDNAALDAAKRARFSPAMQDGRSVRVWVSIPYNFRLMCP